MEFPAVRTDVGMCRGCSLNARNSGKECNVLYYAGMFLFFGLIAGGLNWAGIATVATQGSWTLLVSGSVLLVIHLAARRAGWVF
jgi:uncharacterized membrane protein YtjA (UPF0391 family)